NFETDSYHQFGRDRFLSAPLMKWMYDMYIADPAKRTDIHASPLRASLEQLKGLPPALIQVAENDILRDEGEAYGRKLDEAGVEVATIRYDGAIHDFGLLNGLANEPATRALFRHPAAELKPRLRWRRAPFRRSPRPLGRYRLRLEGNKPLRASPFPQRLQPPALNRSNTKEAT